LSLLGLLLLVSQYCEGTENESQSVWMMHWCISRKGVGVQSGNLRCVVNSQGGPFGWNPGERRIGTEERLAVEAVERAEMNSFPMIYFTPSTRVRLLTPTRTPSGG